MIDPPPMALRTLAARVRTSAAAVRLQTPALGLSPPPAGRPNLHSAAAAPRRHPPAGGCPCLISSMNLVRDITQSQDYIQKASNLAD